ncbi:MAG: penicillin acylase family protein [candidate division KSB1 bacterium]|nr:penicillin acylase family protein [candidate division KSB1 bacterium]
MVGKVLRSAAVAVAVLLSLGLVCRLFLRVPAPPYEGRLLCPGLHDEVRVERDPYGIPHITARDRHDLFFAQGFVLAQDRLWQMDFFRRLGRGRLAEVIGRQAIRYDSLFLSLRLADVAERSWSGLSAESREILQAFAEGVNACIRQRGDKLPLEFALLGYKPQPWRPQDCLVISRLLAWSLSMGWVVDPVYSQLVDSLGLAKVAEIEPEPGILSSTLQDTSLAGGVRWYHWLALMQTVPATASGSNNWAVAPSRTISGSPILCNDPHLLFLSPGFWYLLSLRCDDYEALGANIPGVPGIIVGRNRWVAWGVTNGMLDDVDFFLEELSKDSSQCQGPAGPEPVRTVWDTLFVKGEKPTRFAVHLTPRGPLVSHLLRDSAHAVALSWIGYEQSDEVRAYLRLAASQTVTEAIRALEDYLAPAQNFVFADVQGRIAYKLAGRVPRRQWPGLLLRRAWEERDRWIGLVPYGEMPELLDPPDGFVASANYIPPGAREYLSCYWEPSGRIERIRQLLSSGTTWTADDLRKMQLDTVSVYAVRFVQEATKWIPMDSLDRRQTDFLLLLRQWDGRMARQGLEPALYAAFLLKLSESVFKDEMGDTLYAHFTLLPNLPLRVLLRLLTEGQSSWFDDVRTPGPESVRETVLRAYREAFAFLKGKLGDDPGRWRWGELHRVVFQHPLAVNWIAARALNAGTFPHPGGICTINNAAFGLQGDFTARVGPSLRLVADLSSPEPQVWAVTVPGQCEIPRTPYFANLIEMWRQGRLVSIGLRGSNVRTLILSP